MTLDRFALPLTLLFGAVFVTVAPPLPRQVHVVASQREGLTGHLDGQPGMQTLRITIEPGSRLPRLRRMTPDRGYLVEGELHVEAADGTWRTVRPGDALGDDVDAVHRGVAGDTGATVLVFYGDELA